MESAPAWRAQAWRAPRGEANNKTPIGAAGSPAGRRHGHRSEQHRPPKIAQPWRRSKPSSFASRSIEAMDSAMKLVQQKKVPEADRHAQGLPRAAQGRQRQLGAWPSRSAARSRPKLQQYQTLPGAGSRSPSKLAGRLRGVPAGVERHPQMQKMRQDEVAGLMSDARAKFKEGRFERSPRQGQAGQGARQRERRGRRHS